MKILVLNGSPRPRGHTAMLVDAFAQGAREGGHTVDTVAVCERNIAGCQACGYCHQKDSGYERQCRIQDDMQQLYPLLDEAEMIVLASPVYYHAFSGQLQCAINRMYALEKPKKLKKAALILSSGSDHVQDGAVYEYEQSFLNYLHLQDMGRFFIHGKEMPAQANLEKLREFGRSLDDDQDLFEGMSREEFLEAFQAGKTVTAGSAALRLSGCLSQRALKITMNLNSKYHDPEEVQQLFAELTMESPGEGFGLFPPFYTDCGINTHIGRNVFLNSGCRFQDQGGIWIGDGSLIGHNAVLATLNHGLEPDKRHDLMAAPIIIGKNVWLGANVTILQGVTIGDNAVIAAGAVVTRDVPANAVAGGVPAKVLRIISAEEEN